MFSTGYMLLMDGRSCADIDECKENPRICNGGKCTNTPGSYTCTCQDGLTTSPDGITCEGSIKKITKNYFPLSTKVSHYI